MTKGADDYNHAELIAGRLTISHVTALVLDFQARCKLPTADQDGKAGPRTRMLLDAILAGGKPPIPTPATFQLRSPLPMLAGSRKAQITSEFRPADRPDHDGVDLFYRWKPGDKPDFVGDKGCAGKNADGTPKWVVPYGVNALAAAAGIVQIAGDSKTGYRLWIDHGNGLRTGYFHLLDLKVAIGQTVIAGTWLGLVGDNPKDNDGRHSHFELSPVDRYAPIDPAPYLTL